MSRVRSTGVFGVFYFHFFLLSYLPKQKRGRCVTGLGEILKKTTTKKKKKKKKKDMPTVAQRTLLGVPPGVPPKGVPRRVGYHTG